MTKAGQITIGELLAQARRDLQEAGIDNPALDARLLVQHAAGLTPEDMISRANEAASNETADALAGLLARRIEREPVSRILGRREFWSMDFRLSPGTLDPRPDSEAVVEAVLEWVDENGLRDAPLNIVDLGTGTGCLLLAVLSELPNAFGMGVDISSDSIMTAEANAKGLGFSERSDFRNQSWDDLEPQHFDIVISNPPYIPETDSESLAPEVARFDPEVALYGGIDGLENYRKIAGLLKNFLAKNGAAFFEVGIGQFKDVQQIFEQEGFLPGCVKRDLAGIERCVRIDSPNCG